MFPVFQPAKFSAQFLQKTKIKKILSPIAPTAAPRKKKVLFLVRVKRT